MKNNLFCLPQWETLQDSERVAAAHDLVKQLPKGFAFHSLEICHLGKESHPVAYFDWNPDVGLAGKFALIPGGEVTLELRSTSSGSPWGPAVPPGSTR